MEIGQPFLTIKDHVHTYEHVYVYNTKKSLALNLEIGKINWHSTVIADIRDSALSLVVSQMADPTHLWSAIFMFCSENGRWQAAISSSVTLCFIRYTVGGKSLVTFSFYKTVHRFCFYARKYKYGTEQNETEINGKP